MSNGERNGRVDLDRLAAAITAELEQLGWKRRGGEWHGRCPAPAHQDADPSADWNPERKCWNCRSRGCHEGRAGAVGLARLLSFDLDDYREPSPEAARRNGRARPKVEPTDLANFAAERGLDPAALVAGWKVTPTVYRGRPALRYPTAVGVDRLKFTDGERPKYTWAKRGGKAHWYGLAGALDLLKASDGSLYVVNGEPAVWAAHQRGVPAVCLCGEGMTGVARKLAPQLREALTAVGRPVAVRVVFDLDPAGENGGPAVAAALESGSLDVATLDLRAAPWGADGPPAGADVGDLAFIVGNGLGPALASLPVLPVSTSDGVPFCAPGKYDCSELGNADRLVELYGARLRWCGEFNEWLIYDGRRWARARKEQALALGKLTARSILKEASEVADDDTRKALIKWAQASLTRGRITATLDLAKPDLAIEAADLDADPWALNVANGTLNLRTGALRPHDPAHLLTKLCPVPYVEAAHRGLLSPDDTGAGLWRNFLETATDADAELIGFLQRVAGASLAGVTREDAWFLVHGPGGTSKTTFLRALAFVLGDYAVTIDAEGILAQRYSGGPTPELSKLEGCRLAAIEEIPKNRKLAEGVVKNLTGGSTMSTNDKYERSRSWVPQFVLIIAANDRPVIRGDDSGSWRRVREVPFTHVIPDELQDVALKDAREGLGALAGPAILAWAVDGCLAWQRDGLGSAAKVKAATADYREAMDPLSTWLADRVILEPDAWTATATLYASYRLHAESEGEEPVTQVELGKLLQARGFTQSRPRLDGKKVRGYEGLRLRMADDPDEPEADGGPATPPAYGREKVVF